MYQQWQQGMEVRAADNIRFVELVMRQTKASQEEVLKELSKCRWFSGIDNIKKV
jgi:NACalpha-BTF3-like transcription factor